MPMVQRVRDHHARRAEGAAIAMVTVVKHPPLAFQRRQEVRPVFPREALGLVCAYVNRH